MTYCKSMFFLGNLILVCSFVIQPKGPTHRNLAIKCITEVTKDAINFTKTKHKNLKEFLLTYVITKNLSTPAHYIQEEVLKLVHRQEVWSIQILENRTTEFKSYKENCKNQDKDCKEKHVKNYKTQFYIMVVESIENFNKKINYLIKGSTFNSEALILIYISKTSIISNISTIVMAKLRSYSIINSIVMVPKNLTTFNMYQLRMDNDVGTTCFSNWHTELSHQCIKGRITKHETNLFKEHLLEYFRSCTVTVHAIPIEPFVINKTNKTTGIEIDILRELGRALNISFEIKISDARYHLGEKLENGTWTGFVAPIYNFWQMGIGNIAPDNKYYQDFTYSIGYYSETVAWVVPIATIIPRWRVLTVIFTLEMWGICFIAIVGSAILFYITKTKKEVVCFKTFEKCFTAAFELIIGVPVPHQPKTHFTRVFFIALAIFGIIINSIYTSSLVYYLQNLIREHQISTFEEIAMSDIGVGGPAKYKEMMRASKTLFAKKVLNRYQTVNDSLDTYKYWLNLVGNKRNIATISIRVCVNYLISTRSIVSNSQGDPKVFIVPKPIMSQTIGMMMRRGAFAKEKINLLLQKLIIESGIIGKIKSDYVRVGISNKEQDNPDLPETDETDDKSVSALSIHHLEGAFTILALGLISGILVFVLEVIYFYIRRAIKKNK